MKRTFKRILSKKILIIFYLILFTTPLYAQKPSIKLKTQKVIINGTEVFKFSRGWNGANEDVSLYNIISNEEVIYIKDDNGGTTQGPNSQNDDFVTYNFLNIKTKVEIRGKFRLISEIAFLYSNGVFDLEGNLNNEKINRFKDKYDENISGKTIISR